MLAAAAMDQRRDKDPLATIDHLLAFDHEAERTGANPGVSIMAIREISTAVS